MTFSDAIPVRLKPAVEIANKELARQLRIVGSTVTVGEYTVAVGTKGPQTCVRFMRKPHDSPFISMDDIGSYLVILEGRRIVKRTLGP